MQERRIRATNGQRGRLWEGGVREVRKHPAPAVRGLPTCPPTTAAYSCLGEPTCVPTATLVAAAEQHHTWEPVSEWRHNPRPGDQSAPLPAPPRRAPLSSTNTKGGRTHNDASWARLISQMDPAAALSPRASTRLFTGDRNGSRACDDRGTASTRVGVGSHPTCGRGSSGLNGGSDGGYLGLQRQCRSRDRGGDISSRGRDGLSRIGGYGRGNAGRGDRVSLHDRGQRKRRASTFKVGTRRS